jgi:hypothetical protein
MLSPLTSVSLDQAEIAHIAISPAAAVDANTALPIVANNKPAAARAQNKERLTTFSPP